MMTSKLDLFAAHAASRGWPYAKLPDADVLRVDFDVVWTRWSTFVIAEEGKFAVTLRARNPQPVPRDRIAEAMEYITRVNTHLDVGAFELDLDDGTVGFRTAMWVRGLELTDQHIGNLFDTLTLGYTAYLRGLEKVIAGTETIEDAILEAEGRG